MRGAFALAVLVVMSFADPGEARKARRAPDDAHARAAANTAHVIGVQLYKAGDHAGALAAFERAYLLYEDTGILFNIAQCRRALGDTEQATRIYRRVLVKAPRHSPLAQSAERILDAMTPSSVTVAALPDDEDDRPVDRETPFDSRALLASASSIFRYAPWLAFCGLYQGLGAPAMASACLAAHD